MLFGWETGAEGLGTSYYLLLTLVRSLDAISFVLLSFLCIRDYRVRRTRWGGGAYCALVVTFAVLYLDILAEEAVWITTGRSLQGRRRLRPCRRDTSREAGWRANRLCVNAGLPAQADRFQLPACCASHIRAGGPVLAGAAIH
jgi:hypothetical protein